MAKLNSTSAPSSNSGKTAQDAAGGESHAATDLQSRWQPGEAPGLYRLLVASVLDYAIFALDPTGHIRTWNAGAQRIKGYTPEEIIGQHFSIFYPPDKIAEGFPDYELEVAARDGRFEDEDWRVRKDGSRFWANVVITALRDESGTLVGFGKVTRDLTERRMAEERAISDAHRVAEAEAANRAKSEFLASMSHELRTPLNAIGGYTDLLLLGVAGTIDPDKREYLDRIKRSQQHLLGIINDLLNFSRLEAGRVSFDMQPMSLGDAIRRVLPMIEPQARQRALRVDIEKTREEFASADPSKVEQILVNLLSNAVKFTEPGGAITITQFQDGEWSGVRVHDTGIGIPTSKLEAIFEPFVQVGRTLNSTHEGTGLGLSISRELARAMGGDLTAESTPGAGSTFTLRLRRP